MGTRADKKKIKQLQKKIDILERKLSQTEVRPCQGDNDLKKREEEITELINEIKILKKERDNYLYSWK
jgi:hypothetical protein